MNTYRGESLSKKVARVIMFARLLDWMSPKKENVATTASLDLGDIPTLRAFGVKDENIWAFDTDKEAIEKCKAVYPTINAIHDDIVNLYKYTDKHFKINLDLCSNLSDNLMKHLAPVINHPNTYGFSITFLKCRDKPVIEAAKNIRRPQSTSHDEDAIVFDRAEFVSSYLPQNRNAPGGRITEFPSTFIEYNSGRAPMLTLNYTGNGIRSAYRGFYAYPYFHSNYVDVRVVEINLKRIQKADIGYLLKTWPSIHEFLNISKRSAAAMKAHVTMGTYGEPSDTDFLNSFIYGTCRFFLKSEELHKAMNRLCEMYKGDE